MLPDTYVTSRFCSLWSGSRTGYHRSRPPRKTPLPAAWTLQCIASSHLSPERQLLCNIMGLLMLQVAEDHTRSRANGGKRMGRGGRRYLKCSSLQSGRVQTFTHVFTCIWLVYFASLGGILILRPMASNTMVVGNPVPSVVCWQKILCSGSENATMSWILSHNLHSLHSLLSPKPLQ